MILTILKCHCVFFRGRLKRRGPADSAFTAEKLKELNSKRPYPFLSGLLTSSHFRSPHPHPYSNMVDSKMNSNPMMSYQENSTYPSTNSSYVPYQNGFYGINSNPTHYNAFQNYDGSKVQMVQRPCYSMNALSASPPEPLVPNAVVSNETDGKPVVMKPTQGNYTEMSNMNVNMGSSTNDLFGEKYQMTPPQMTSQSGYYNTETRSPPFNQINPSQQNTPGHYEKSLPLSAQNALLTTTGHAKYENISPPSATALRNSSAESFQTPGSWHYQLSHKDYRLTHNDFQANATTQQTPTYHQQNAEFTPLQSPETSPPCEYQTRQATGRVVPSNVTVNFNNYGNSHIGIDTPLEFPLSFDFPDITQQNQCVQQQSFVNYA